MVAERGEAHVAAVGRDADAVDPGAADDRDSPAALGARPQDGERVVADAGRVGPAALLDSVLQLLLLGGEVDARHAGAARRRPTAGRSRPSPASARASSSRDLEHVERRRPTPRWCGELSGPRTSERTRAVGRDEREVGLRVAAVDGEDERRAHAGGSSRRARLVGFEQALEELARSACLADQRMREQRLARERAVARDRRLGGEPLVRGDVLDEPEQLRRERRLRQRHGAGPS